MQNKGERIVIIGAGLVGSLWALLLRQRGFAVEIFEKREDPRRQSATAGRSINLILTSRGLNGLAQAGLHKKALELAVTVYGRMIHSRTGDLLSQPYGRADECNYAISRSDLNHLLMQEAEKAGVKIHFAHSLERIDRQKKQLHFTGRQTLAPLEYDILFAADGAGSVVRKILEHEAPQIFRSRTEWLEADYKELTMPLQAGEAPLDTKALHIWPRGSHMLMGLGNRDGSMTMTLYLPKKGGPWSFAKLQSPEDVEKFFAAEFTDAVPKMPNYLQEFASNPQGPLGTVRCEKWTDGESIALLGDAAHAIVPFFGQGMNLGFEDCSTLLQLLESETQWSEILQKYDLDQRPNANAIADMALENWVEMRDKVGDPEFQLRKKVEAILEKEFPNEYRSRYGLITYTLVPYAKAKKIGERQVQMLQRLCQGLHSEKELNLNQANSILKEEFLPFLESQKVVLDPFQAPS